uniref:Reverse transcriptase domain-containing protein n=1 Tax=Fagus sylvatica TaxID=28930 RepID=A0A2N9I0Z5_FAGSY
MSQGLPVSSFFKNNALQLLPSRDGTRRFSGIARPKFLSSPQILKRSSLVPLLILIQIWKISIQVELNGWLACLETVWRQKSRETWLKEGDRNSRFFHLSTVIRRKHNSIDAIKSDSGDWIISKSEIKKFVVSKFIDLFTEEPISFPSGLDNLISPTISSMQNEALCNIPTPLEIKNVIFGMYNLKAPGPDGLPALFYKQYWPIVGESVISVVQNFFRSGHMLNECVSFVSFSILINGGKTDYFKPSRGLRQGDPLSPYLFILCQEVLSRLIDRQFNSGAINGVKMNPSGPAFTHVMYADDLMLFAKATSRKVSMLDDCLELYCQWAIKKELNMKTISDHANYLGAPLFTSRSRSKDFKFLQEKVESRLKGWRCKSLSWVGQSTLIKSVAMAIPSYTFASFDVLNVVCDKLDAAARRSSLCIQALRSKYKVRSDWMSREAPKNASQTWKAIERLKKTVECGACFLVGDGAVIDIWKDP